MAMRTFAGFKIILPVAIAAAVLCAPVLAVDVKEVSALLRAKQYGAALAQADAHLAGRPDDPQIRFLRGLALVGMERRDDAIACFTKLTSDYPDMPEPYNNVAVLHAANGQYDQAREALEAAVKANPDYARAHENLADLYLQLASRSYAATLKLEPNHAGARARQALLREALAERGDARK
jgi:Flp pilus assembly protein TadD